MAQTKMFVCDNTRRKVNIPYTEVGREDIDQAIEEYMEKLELKDPVKEAINKLFDVRIDYDKVVEMANSSEKEKLEDDLTEMIISISSSIGLYCRVLKGLSPDDMRAVI